MHNSIAALMEWSSRATILVVGDLMLDVYIRGDVLRISPEAPVPVLRFREERYMAGGAANVIMNLRGLGCRVLASGVVGDDQDGSRLLEILRKAEVDISAVVEVEHRTTTVKTRVLDVRQQMLRIDKETTVALEQRYQEEMVRRIQLLLEHERIDAILLSDYRKGVLIFDLCRWLVRTGRENSILVAANTKKIDDSRYEGASMLSLNRFELAHVSRQDPENFDGLLAAAERLRDSWRLGFLAVTLGASGIALVGTDGIATFPAVSREVYDVSGAGDTVIAMLGAAVCAGIKPERAVQLANLAAGVVVRKLGTAPITLSELVPAANSHFGDPAYVSKIFALPDFLPILENWRRRGDRVVFTNGCFDLLHRGHIALFEHARRNGDKLIVGLNTDRSIKSMKGPGRPVVRERDRAAAISAFPCVDAVILFDEPTPIDLIHALRPHVLVKGGDYKEDEIVGAKEVREWGGRVVISPLIQGLSTSAILARAVHS